MGDLVTSADRETARLRDRLAEIEVETATLAAELAAFNADYLRVGAKNIRRLRKEVVGLSLAPCASTRP